MSCTKGIFRWKIFDLKAQRHENKTLKGYHKLNEHKKRNCNYRILHVAQLPPCFLNNRWFEKRMFHVCQTAVLDAVTKTKRRS